MIGTAPAPRNGHKAAAPPASAHPVKHLCFDLETGDAPEAAIEVEQELVDAASNIKDPAKIQENLEKQRDTIRKKAALLDSAPIACMSWVTERERVLFHHMGAPWGKYKAPKKLKDMPDVELQCARDERGMLIALRDWLQPRAVVDRDPEGKTFPSVLIGHNVKEFDLLHLRFAYVRHRLVAPFALWPEAIKAGVEVFDTMKTFLYDYSNWHRGDRYIRLEVISALMGLPNYKQRMKGEDVPGYVAQGKFEEVGIYNVLDSLQTYRIFLGLANQGEDQAQA